MENNLITIVKVVTGMKRMMILINNYNMGRGKSILLSIRTCQKRAESLHWRLGKTVNEEKW